jgi:hypothetical protein
VGCVLHTSATRVRLCKYTVYPIFMCYVIYASHVTFSYELPSAFYGTVMALRKNRVRSLHDRSKLIHEVEKNPGKKRVDIAKRLGLPAITSNCIFAKKNDIREQVQKCGNACKKRKITSTQHELN